MVPFENVSGQGFQSLGVRTQAAQAPRTLRRSIVSARRRLSSTPNKPGNVSLPRSASLPARFAQRRLVAAHVEQVVGDLKRQPQPRPYSSSAARCRPRRPADQRSQLAARPETSRRSCGGESLRARSSVGRAQLRRPDRRPGRPTSCRGAGGAGQHGAALGRDRAAGRTSRASTSKASVNSASPARIASRLAEDLVAGRPAAAQVVVVHRRQVVVDQRIGVDHLDGAGRRQRRLDRRRRKPRPPSTPASAAAACRAPTGCSESPRAVARDSPGRNSYTRRGQNRRGCAPGWCRCPVKTRCW